MANANNRGRLCLLSTDEVYTLFCADSDRAHSIWHVSFLRCRLLYFCRFRFYVPALSSLLFALRVFSFFQFASGPSLREQECAAVVVADRAASDFSRAAGAKGPHAPQARVDLRP